MWIVVQSSWQKYDMMLIINLYQPLSTFINLYKPL